MKKNIHSRIIKKILIISFGAFFFLIHLRYLQMFLDSDQLVYLANVLTTYKGIILNPHHLFFEVHAYWFDQFIRTIHPDFLDLTFNLRIRSLLSASIGIVFYGVLIYRLTKNFILTFSGMILIGFSHGYTHYASKIDTGIFPVAWFPIIILISDYIFYIRKRFYYFFGIIVLSFIFFLGIMQHQTMILTAISVFLGWILPYKNKEHNKKSIIAKPSYRWSGSILLGILTFILVAFAYWAAGKMYYHLPYDKPNIHSARGVWRYQSFQQWLFTYHVSGVWGKGHKEFDIRMPLRGFTDGVLSQQKLKDKYNKSKKFLYNFSSLQSIVSQNSFLHNFIFILLIFIILSLFFLSYYLAKIYGRIYFVLLLSFLLYFFLGSYWEPHYFEFWIMPVSITWLLFILILNFLFSKLYSQEKSHKLTNLFKGWLVNALKFTVLFLALMIGIYNLKYNTIPHSQYIYLEGTGKYKNLDFTNRYKMKKMYRKFPVSENYPKALFRQIP